MIRGNVIWNGGNPLWLLNDPESDDADGHPYYQADAQDDRGALYSVEWNAHWEGSNIWDSSVSVDDWDNFVVTEVRK